MAIADRKERERREREKLILDHADDLLRFNGYLGLNLDELAKRIEYSKATIYNHFQSKEDLVLAVAVMHIDARTEYFQRALTFNGRARERMFAIGIADHILAQFYPHGFPTMQLVRTQSIWEKAAPERQESFLQRNGSCVQIAMEIIRQARTAGDLAEDSPPDDQILSGLVSMAKGAHLLADTKICDGTDIDALKYLNPNYHVFLDGAGWKPFTKDWNYEDTEKQIWDDLFAVERNTLTKG